MNAMYLDIHSVFDKMRQQRLLIELKSHGMGQRVIVERDTSAWTAVCRPLHRGLPHCLVMGPLLFLICIHDLEDYVSSNIIKFGHPGIRLGLTNRIEVLQMTNRADPGIDKQGLALDRQTCIRMGLTKRHTPGIGEQDRL